LRSLLFGLLLAGPAAQAEVRLDPPEATVQSGGSLPLTASYPAVPAAAAAAAQVPVWTVTGQGAALTRNSDAIHTFTAPEVAEPTVYRVRVTVAGQWAEAKLTVLPKGLMPEVIQKTLMPHSQGAEWAAPPPRMYLLGYTADIFGFKKNSLNSEQARLCKIRSMRFLDDPAMGEQLDRCFMIATRQGIFGLTLRGDLRPLCVDGPALKAAHLTTRPRGSSPRNLLHVAFAVPSSDLLPDGYWEVWVVGPDHRQVLLAGGSDPAGKPFDPPVSQAGTGAQARFGRITGLAMGRSGHVHVATKDAIWRVNQRGEVSLLAGKPDDRFMDKPRDGQGKDARFESAGPMVMYLALDPRGHATGPLDNPIRKVRAGSRLPSGRLPWPANGFLGAVWSPVTPRKGCRGSKPNRGSFAGPGHREWGPGRA
jgi:hypothetical protein